MIQEKHKIYMFIKNIFSNNYRVYLTYFSVLLLSLVGGVNMTWTSPMIKKLNGTDDNPLGRILTVDESSWIASIPTLGNIAGSLAFGASGQMAGRKTLVTSLGIPYAIFYLAMPFAKNVWIFIFLRFLSGASYGGATTLLPLYMSELAKPKVRGRIFVLYYIANNVGFLITYSTAPFVPFFWYHIGMAILPIFFLIIFPIFALESPYYIIKNDPIKAEELLKKLREKDDVTEEFNEMKMGIQKHSTSSIISILRTRASRKALLISLGLTSACTFTGTMIVITYAYLIFDAAGGAWTTEVNTIILTVFQIFLSIASTSVADRFGRKPILAISFGVISLSEIMLGSYFILKDNGTDVGFAMKWLPIVSLVLFITALCFASTGLMIGGELFPMKTKEIAMVIVVVYGGVVGFLATFFFQRLQIAFGLGTIFLIFAGFAVCTVIFILTILIETKGKSLDQIQDELEGNVNKMIDVKV